MNFIPDDHLDLIVTAALEWKVLVGPPAAALSMPGSLTSLDGTRAGTLIRQMNTIVQHLGSPAEYTYRPVPGPLIPVEVIKACHAAIHTCSRAPYWETSVAHTLLTKTAWAAAVRVPGYAEAPWIWTRSRTSQTLAIAETWRPEPLAVNWSKTHSIEPETWASAAAVLVTEEALPAVSGLLAAGQLAARPNVFAILPDPHLDPALWGGVADHVLIWPDCRPWLDVQLGAAWRP